MNRPALLLVVAVTLAAALAACSRAGPVVDDPAPSAVAGSSGIPPAASGARIDLAGDPARAATDAGAASPPPIFPTIPTAHPPGTPHLRDEGLVLSKPSLPPEVVRRIVRQNFGRLRLCYENGLRSDPSLAGTVRVRFVIRADGSAGSATDAGSTLADRTVVECVRHAFELLSFPEPSPPAPIVATYSVSFAPPAP